MRRKFYMTCFIIVCVLGIIFANDLVQKKKKYSIKEQKGMFRQFNADQSKWENGMLVENDRIIFIDGNGRMAYRNIDSEASLPLCTVSDCSHNNEDCEAIFSFDFSPKVICGTEDKLMVIGNTINGVRIYRSNVDGTDHELVMEQKLNFDNYDEIGDIDFYAYGSSVLIAVSMWDTSQQKVLEDGTISDVLSNVKIFEYNINTQKIKKLYQLPQDYYQSYVQFRYVYNDVVYYDYTGSYRPYEEIYDATTGQLKNPDVPDSGPMEVHALNLNNCNDSVVENQTFGDYIGNREDEYYYYEFDDNHLFTGYVISRNLKNDEVNRIYIDKLEGKNCDDYRICVLDSCIVLDEHEMDKESGVMTFYDYEGNVIKQIDNCTWYINGEYKDVYWLGTENISKTSGAYINKNDVDKMKVKIIDEGV